ncbi:MAG: hypothetical protein PHE49_04150 [bacterium]|nr:hypothetical protein [bacterium]
MKTNNRIVVILSLGIILSNVSFAKESLPFIDKKHGRLKNETRIFNQSGNQRKSSVFAQKDTFIDNNKDGINDRLNKERDSSPLFQFLNDKVSSSLSNDKSSSVKEPVGTVPIQKSNAKSISGEQIKYPKRPEKPVVNPAKSVTVKKPVPLKVKTK